MPAGIIFFGDASDGEPMTWPGGKNGCGAYQRIINHMPPHDTFIEAFCGSGAVIRNKRPAKRNIAIDPDQEALNLAAKLHPKPETVEWYRKSAFTLLDTVGFRILAEHSTLVYFDPPYLPETRKGGDLYAFELTEADHIRLLDFAVKTEAMVMISGYRSDLYDEHLSGWTRIDYRTQTRRGMVDESLWMNFPVPTRLHDYSYLGDNFRERERIKRKKARFRAKFEKMDRLERLAIMDVLEGV